MSSYERTAERGMKSGTAKARLTVVGVVWCWIDLRSSEAGPINTVLIVRLSEVESGTGMATEKRQALDDESLPLVVLRMPTRCLYSAICSASNQVDPTGCYNNCQSNPRR